MTAQTFTICISCAAQGVRIVKWGACGPCVEAEMALRDEPDAYGQYESIASERESRRFA